MLKDNRPKIIAPRCITHIEDPITECDTLGDIRDSVAKLIEEYGEDAKYEFDSGPNNIIEAIWVEGEETDQEYRNRCDREDAEERIRVRQAEIVESNERVLLKKLLKKYGTP